MAEHRYKAVVIDLFDTLVTWNPDGLPLMQFRGREIRSTTPLLYETLETALGKALRPREILGGARVGLQRYILRAS